LISVPLGLIIFRFGDSFLFLLKLFTFSMLLGDEKGS